MLGHGQVTVQAGTPMTVTGKGTLSCVLGQGVDLTTFRFFCLKISRGGGWYATGSRTSRRGQRPGACKANRSFT